MYPLIEDTDLIELAVGNYISVENFENRFGSVEEHQFNYNYFVNHEKTTLGWQQIFDDWKQKGILN